MKRRTLDIILSTGGLVVAALLVVVGLVLASNASFAKDYVRDQLAEQKLQFKAADELSPAEKAYTDARSGCLYTYAGETLSTGRHAECFANEYIGGHLRDPQRIKNANGMTYSELGDVQGDLRTKIAAAEAAADPQLATLQKQLTDVTTARDTVFKGEMLRGALLTTYGFSVFGDKADQFSTVAFALAALLALLSIAGLVHAFVTPRSKTIPVPEHQHAFPNGKDRELLNV